MDTIFLSDLRVETVIGIFDWERRIRQVVSIDLEMAADVRKAAAADSIESTLDYKSVAKRLISFVESSDFGLVETLAEAIARIIITEFGIPWVKVTLHKPGAIRGARDVGVNIERSEDDYGD
jgi:dihydroneopterin aldolase